MEGGPIVEKAGTLILDAVAYRIIDLDLIAEDVKFGSIEDTIGPNIVYSAILTNIDGGERLHAPVLDQNARASGVINVDLSIVMDKIPVVKDADANIVRAAILPKVDDGVVGESAG